MMVLVSLYAEIFLSVSVSVSVSPLFIHSVSAHTPIPLQEGSCLRSQKESPHQETELFSTLILDFKSLEL
jgi:hypothetical protein